MVKPLSFKGDKKIHKKRKRPAQDEDSIEPSESKSKALTTASADQDDDTWVNGEIVADITGPIVFVLPTEIPSALSCDATGKVFPLPLENMIDNDPLSAEPHDVRQVWIANRVAGSEKFSFKSHHGKYLGCDKFGILTALKEAISPEESFLCIPVADSAGSFAVQTEREKFLTIDEATTATDKKIRADAELIDFNSSIRIRMQARFKPKLKVAKEEKAMSKISRKELEDMVGRRLDEEDVKTLKRARREGNFHEKLLDVKVKGKHDKFA
jgi:protein FRG1